MNRKVKSLRYAMNLQAKWLGLCLTVLLFWTTPVWAFNSNPVDITVNDTPVRDVLMAMARVAGVNMVIDDSVTGSVTIQLADVPFDDALDIVTQTKGLTYERVGNVIMVANAGISSGTSEKNGGKTAVPNRHFGSVHVLKLQHIRAEDVIDKVALLLGDLPQGGQDSSGGSGSSTNLVNSGNSSSSSSSSSSSNNPGALQTSQFSPLSSINQLQAVKTQTDGKYSRTKIDPISNSIVFLGSNHEAEMVQALLDQLDIAYPEVLIEAKIVSADKTAAEQLGLQWNWSTIPATVSSSSSSSSSSTTTNYPGVISFGRNPQGSHYQFQYQATLNALVSHGDAKVLAEPRIMAINGQAAFIQVGDSVPISTQTITTTQTSNSFTYMDSGIILTYIPHISGDGTITAELQTEVSTPNWVSDLKTYSFAKKIANTEVRVKDGETVIIGGLMNTLESKDTTKVPLLGDLPLVGGLFRNSDKSSESHEVMIFLTSHIVPQNQ